jgi:quinol monooxygenase YgiN
MTPATVSMTMQWLVPLGMSRSVTEALHSLMVAARAEPGFVRCSISTDLSKQVGVRYTEEWASEDHLRRMLQSDHFCTLAELMDEATEPPSITFTLPSGNRGLDYVEEIRG